MSSQGEDLLSAAEAAEALSATSQTIRNWIRDGRLRSVGIGHRFYVPVAEVERVRGGGGRRESVWAFDVDESVPAPSLPRAGAAGSGDGSDEGVLGG